MVVKTFSCKWCERRLYARNNQSFHIQWCNVRPQRWIFKYISYFIARNLKIWVWLCFRKYGWCRICKLNSCRKKKLSHWNDLEQKHWRKHRLPYIPDMRNKLTNSEMLANVHSIVEICTRLPQASRKNEFINSKTQNSLTRNGQS